MRISDWSSDVCSSDLRGIVAGRVGPRPLTHRDQGSMHENHFKKAIASGSVQLGLWQAFASALPAELCASCGFDWLLFDGEHGPNTVQTLLAQIQAVAAYPVRSEEHTSELQSLMRIS